MKGEPFYSCFVSPYSVSSNSNEMTALSTWSKLSTCGFLLFVGNAHRLVTWRFLLKEGCLGSQICHYCFSITYKRPHLPPPFSTSTSLTSSPPLETTTPIYSEIKLNVCPPTSQPTPLSTLNTITIPKIIPYVPPPSLLVASPNLLSSGFASAASLSAKYRKRARRALRKAVLHAASGSSA